MKFYAYLFILFLSFTGVASAQNNNVSLRLQSPDGKNVKLVWFVKQWDKSITGFDIRRLEGAQNWVKLNKKALLPEFTSKKDFSLSESDKMECSRIKGKMTKLLKAGKYKETPNAAFIASMIDDHAQALKLVANCSNDYDFAMMNGLAYVDHSVTKKESYVYGLFMAGTDSLLAKATWNYGEQPDLNVVTEITSRIRPNRKGIELIWDADTDKVDNGSVVGFYIYRDGIRLNQDPLMTPTNKDSCEFVWIDNTADKENTLQYSISAVSLFGIEGSIKSYDYVPADHPATYLGTTGIELYSQGLYRKEGILISWAFPKAQEKYIKGFYIDKNNMPDGYKRVSHVLAPSVREYIDKSATPVNGYVCYRVMALYKDKSAVRGQEKVFTYFPEREPPQPQNLKAKTKIENNKQFIELTWDPPILGDTITSYYRVYVWDSAERKYELLATPKISTNKYEYEVKNVIASYYKLCISSFSFMKAESVTSLPASAYTRTTVLPPVLITKIYANGNIVNLEWNDYPAITDLKGFRIYQNNTLIANEQQINASIHNFIAQPLADGTYNFTIQAVTDNGIESSLTSPSSISILPAEKKSGGK